MLTIIPGLPHSTYFIRMKTSLTKKLSLTPVSFISLSATNVVKNDTLSVINEDGMIKTRVYTKETHGSIPQFPEQSPFGT